MDEQELLERIADLELEAEYGEPAEAAKAAMELAKCQNQLARLHGYDNYFEYKNSVGFDSNSTSYGRGKKPTPQGMYSDADETGISKTGAVSDLDIARQEVFGNTHHSLNYCDALRTMDYSEATIKSMCKQEGIKYTAPAFEIAEKPKATKKNPVKRHTPNPVHKPKNTITRMWN